MKCTVALNDAQEGHLQVKYAIDHISSSTRSKNKNKNDENDLTLVSKYK